MSSSFLKDQVAQFEAYTNSRQPEVRRFVNEYLQGGIIGIDALKGLLGRTTRKQATDRDRRHLDRDDAKKFAKIGVNARSQKRKQKQSAKKYPLGIKALKTNPSGPKESVTAKSRLGVAALGKSRNTPDPEEVFDDEAEAEVDSESPCLKIFDKDSCQEAEGCVPYYGRCLTEEAYQDSSMFMERRDGPTAKEYKAKYDEYSKLNREAQEYLDTEATKLEIEEKEYIADKRKEQDELEAQIDNLVRTNPNTDLINEMLEKLEESEEEFNNKRKEFEDKALEIEAEFLKMAPWRRID